MLLPNIFRNDGLLKGFNGFMDWPAGMTTTTDGALMKSDVKDAGDHYEVLMDLPGFKKEDVKLQLKDGILSFEATKKTERTIFLIIFALFLFDTRKHTASITSAGVI